MPRRSLHIAFIMYTQSHVVSDAPYMCRNYERILIKFGSRDVSIRDFRIPPFQNILGYCALNMNTAVPPKHRQNFIG